jgi:hypothetical protein
MSEPAYRNAIGTGEKFGVRRLAAAFGMLANPEVLKREQAPALQIALSLHVVTLQLSQFHSSLNRTRTHLRH